MDKKLIDSAHEIWAAAQLCPGEGVEDGAQRVAEILARIDAEHGKEEAAVVEGVDGYTGYIKPMRKLEAGTKLFLSPTIPEGMALVPTEPTEEILDAMANTARAMPDDGDLVIQYAAMLSAAQGERK